MKYLLIDDCAAPECSSAAAEFVRICLDLCDTAPECSGASKMFMQERELVCMITQPPSVSGAVKFMNYASSKHREVGGTLIIFHF